MILDRVNLRHQAHALYRRGDGTLRVRYACRMGFDMAPDIIKLHIICEICNHISVYIKTHILTDIW